MRLLQIHGEPTILEHEFSVCLIPIIKTDILLVHVEYVPVGSLYIDINIFFEYYNSCLNIHLFSHHVCLQYCPLAYELL